MLPFFFRPVEDGQNRLALALSQQKDAGHFILGGVAHQVQRRCGASISSHVEEITILDQNHPVGVRKQSGQIVANLIQAARDR